MPIVNGQYVQDQLPMADHKFWNRSRDWSDSLTAEYNFLLKQQENAYNLDLWNLANEYNSPAAQMGRYQDAGLNPNLIYSQQNTTSPLTAAQNSAFRSAGTHNKSVQNQLATIQTLQGLVKSAAETYDYMKYGSETSRWKMIGAQESALNQKLDNAWLDWMLHGDNMIYGDSTRLPSGPAATRYGVQTGLMKNQRDEAYWDVQRVKYMVQALLPSQKERNEALTALDKYQMDMMQGKYGAVLDIHTGLGETVDNWVRLIMFMAMARMM